MHTKNLVEGRVYTKISGNVYFVPRKSQPELIVDVVLKVEESLRKGGGNCGIELFIGCHSYADEI